MTENKRFWCLDEYEGETSPIVDEKFAPTNRWLCNKLNELAEENEQLKQSNKDAWNLIQFIYEEIKEDGSMDWGRIQDLVEF